jgi:3D (Asp-Asp-Asp) domain-containing protein
MDFQLEAPAPQAMGPDLKLWATHYHTPEFRPAAAGAEDALPLLNREGVAISPPLKRVDWCAAALQGSVTVKSKSKTSAYVFVDDDGPEQADCDDQLGNLSDGVKRATRRARFMPVSHPFGCGVRDIPLLPFRTAAVDPGVIPIGSVLYVPELRGIAFQFDGETYVHDGYLYAGDRGGAIHGRHVDVFMSTDDAGPFESLFASTSSHTFSAFIVSDDDPAAKAVRASQSGRCDMALKPPVTTG